MRTELKTRLEITHVHRVFVLLFSIIPHPSSFIPVLAALAAALACAGCGTQPLIEEGNYLTYDHPFSDASAAAVRKSAEGICRQRNQTAVETSRACSLTQCTTNYQCMDEEDARRLAGEKRK
jgi:hypothetical protein